MFTLRSSTPTIDAAAFGKEPGRSPSPVTPSASESGVASSRRKPVLMLDLTTPLVSAVGGSSTLRVVSIFLAGGDYDLPYPPPPGVRMEMIPFGGTSTVPLAGMRRSSPSMIR